MTTEDLMKLADAYARLNAQTTAPGAGDARQALLDALEALGREVARLSEVNADQYGALDLASRECTTLRAELAAIRAQEPVARVTGYYGGRAVVEALNPAAILPQNMALYASPVAKDAGLVADVTQDDAELLARVIEQFEDCGETDVDQATLMRFAAMGLLECTRFEATAKGNEIAAKTDAPLFAASPKIGGV